MLKSQRLSKLLLGSLVLLLTACANVKQTGKHPIYADYISENKLEEVKKITSFRFHGWHSLDNHHLILNTSYNRPYLLSLTNYCVDLNYVNAIVVNNSGSILQAKFDSIVPVPHRGTKCYIKSIHKITRDQVNQITSLRKTNKAKKQSEDKAEKESQA
jgi:hypothetical protein